MDFQFWKDDVQSANFSVKSSNLAVDLLNSRPRPNSRTANSRPRQNLDIPGPGQILPPVVYWTTDRHVINDYVSHTNYKLQITN